MKHVILILIVLTLSSCRVAKKEWVKENYTEKSQLQDFQNSQTVKLNELKETIKQQQQTVNTSQSVNQSEIETTEVTGTLTAEAGKEKTAVIGNTTIKSNGADISFKTNTSNTKQTSKAIQELYTMLDYERNLNESFKSDINTLRNQVVALETQLNAKSKETKKTGLPFSVWLVLFVIVALVFVYFKFRSKLPF